MLNPAALATMLALLSACVDQDAEEARLWSANVATCGAARIHDSGRIVYLTVPNACSESGDLTVTLAYGPLHALVIRTVKFTRFDEPTTVDLAPDVSREMSIHRRGTWRAFPNKDAWTWRDGAGPLAKDEGLYLLGGWDGATNSEVCGSRTIVCARR